MRHTNHPEPYASESDRTTIVREVAFRTILAARKSADGRRRAMRDFDDLLAWWLGSFGGRMPPCISSLTYESAAEYVRLLQTECRSAADICRRISTLKMVWVGLMAASIAGENPWIPIRRPRRPPPKSKRAQCAPATKDIKEIIRRCASERLLAADRDAILVLCAGILPNFGDVCALRMGEVFTAESGHRHLDVPGQPLIPFSASGFFSRYLRALDVISRNSPLFPATTRDGRRFLEPLHAADRSSLHRALTKRGRQNGLESLTPTALRIWYERWLTAGSTKLRSAPQ